MVIKKPYAFLIKHFKAIHLLLSLFMLYILVKSHSIFIFFNNYASSGNYTYSSTLASDYIPGLIFISIVLILIFNVFVYILMRWKKKSRVFYVVIFLIYIVLLAYFLFFYSAFNNILNITLDIRVIRAYRDISLLAYLPQYVLFAMCLSRGLGFNIKKFNFKKDLEELDIAEEDQEEIEVTLNNDNYKIKRWFRKNIAELIYYIKENKVIFYGIILIFVTVIGILLYINVFRKENTYRETEYFYVDGIGFKVVSSYITDVDNKGNLISDLYKYIIVKLELTNNNTKKSSLDSDILRLYIDGENYFPIYSKNDYFVDLGEGYYKNVLYASESHEYLIVYELPKDLEVKNAKFRLLGNVTDKDGVAIGTYKDVTLNLKDYMKNTEYSEYALGSIMDFSDTSLKSSDVIVESYQIADQFTEEFQYCINDCYQGKKIIKPNLVGKTETTILKITIDLNLDKSLYINKFINNNSDFLNYFGNITYTINDSVKTINNNIISLDTIKTNNVYLEVDNEIKRASNIKLEIVIRNKKYVINLYNS